MRKCALARALGESLKEWSEANGVPPRTVRGWAMTPEFKALVESHRARIVDQAIGKLTRHLTKAVQEMGRLIKEGKDDGIKLAAAKALVDRLIAVHSHAELRARYDELRARLAALEGVDAHIDSQASA
jgi:hypothetical protein